MLPPPPSVAPQICSHSSGVSTTQGLFPIGTLCEAAHFGWERGFNTVDAHSCSVPGNACAREQSHTQCINTGRAKKHPRFPCIPSSTSNERRRSDKASLANPPRVLRLPSPLGGVLFAVAVPWILPERVHVRREPRAPVPGPAPIPYVLASKPTQTQGQMSQARTQKYLTPLCQQIFQH